MARESPAVEDRDNLIINMDTSSFRGSTTEKNRHSIGQFEKRGSQLSGHKTSKKSFSRKLSKTRKFIPDKFNCITQSFVDQKQAEMMLHAQLQNQIRNNPPNRNHKHFGGLGSNKIPSTEQKMALRS